MHLCGHAGKLKYFVQGNLIKEIDIADNLAATSDTFVIGARYIGGPYPTLNPTYIDELRISNIARWTEDFTPGEDPTDPVDPPTEPVDNVLLRVTMTDSSEREYRVSKVEADGFVTWMNRDVNTGTTAYPLTKVTTESKEYLLFDKIISFDTKEV